MVNPKRHNSEFHPQQNAINLSVVQSCRDLPPGPRRSLELRTLATRLLLKLIDSARFDATDDPSSARHFIIKFKRAYNITPGKFQKP